MSRAEPLIETFPTFRAKDPSKASKYPEISRNIIAKTLRFAQIKKKAATPNNSPKNVINVGEEFLIPGIFTRGSTNNF